MSAAKHHILVLGAGSVGKRHMQNLSTLGCEISAMDPRDERLNEASDVVRLIDRYRSLDEVSGHWERYSGVVVGSPPNVHVAQCIAAIEAGVPVLLEKPVCPDLMGAQRLADHVDKASAALLLGYTYRWWQPLRLFRDRLQANAAGKPLHAKFVMSAHLADWHPWERYQDFFMASRDLGGGALLDESHFVDLMLWFFGMPDTVYSRVEKLSELEIDTDDNVDIIATYASGLRVYIHLDLYGRPHEKYISVTGEEGTLEWSFDPNRIRMAKSMEHTWDEELFAFERNDMFVAVAREFLGVIEGDQQPSCSIDDGVNVLRVLEACRQSSVSGREVGPAPV